MAETSDEIVMVEEDDESVAEDSPAADSDEPKAPRVNLQHGFLRTIQRNQKTREACDRDVEAMRMAIRFSRSLKTKRSSSGAAARRPERQLYTPKRRTPNAAGSATAEGTASPSHPGSSTASPQANQTPILLEMEVEVAPGTWQTLVIHEDSTPQDVARKVALANDMEPRIAAGLAYHIASAIDRATHGQ